MRYSILYMSLLLPLLSANVCAQQYRGEPFGMFGPPANNPGLDTTGIGNGVTQVQQFYLRPHASLPRGTFYTVLTVVGGGGPGGSDLMTGTYDLLTNTFTANTDAMGLSTSGAEFQGSVSHDLRVLIWDSPNGVKWAARPGTTGQFGTANLVTGLPSGYIDPQFGLIGGQSVVFYISGTDLWVGDFNATTGAVINQRLAAALGSAGGQLHSPTPLDDKAGNSRALWCSNNVSGSDSDLWCNSGVEGLAPSLEVFDNGTGWANNPAAIGGRAIYASSPGYTQNIQIDAVAMSSGTVPNAGGNLDFTVFTPPKPTGAPYVVTVLIGQLGTGPVKHPFGGRPLGLSLAGILSLPSAPTDPITGDFTYSLPLPPLPPGLTVHAQAIGADFTTNTLIVGNTAVLSVK